MGHTCTINHSNHDGVYDIGGLSDVASVALLRDIREQNSYQALNQGGKTIYTHARTYTHTQV